MYENKDGSNKLYKKGENCCLGTNCPFWKQSWEIKSSVRTRQQEKKLELVTLEEYNNYYQKVSKEKMNQQGTAILPN